MKTYPNLIEQIYDFENLYRAWQRAAQGKRNRPQVMRYGYRLEENLIDLQNHLIWGTWQTGEYRHFTLHEPVYREGAALPFRDRVMHHALVAIIEPCFAPSWIDHSYACRAGKGTHRGADYAQALIRRVQRQHGQAYALKADIRKYFRSIDHAALKRLIRRKITCQPTLDLIEGVIDSTANPDDPRPYGIPLGNLTSQLFANVYLDALDQYAKHRLKVRNYVRYMDDFVIIHHDKQYLNALRLEIEAWLADQLHLKTNSKTQIFPIGTHHGRGLDFLGYRIWATHRRLRKDSIGRIKRSLKRLQREYAAGDIDLEQIRPVVHSWLAHASHADTHGLQVAILGAFGFVREGPPPDA